MSFVPAEAVNGTVFEQHGDAALVVGQCGGNASRAIREEIAQGKGLSSWGKGISRGKLSWGCRADGRTNSEMIEGIEVITSGREK